MQKFCQACGIPLERREDFAGGDESSNFCLHCVGEDGAVKSCEDIFEGGVQFFVDATGAGRLLAEKLTRKNMKRLSYWQGSDAEILQGEEATDEEFSEAMNKLG